MSDLSARNATEKFVIFETGQRATLAATSGSLHSARSFSITWRGRRNFSVRALTLTFFNLYSTREEIFLLRTFSSAAKASKKFMYHRIFYSNLLRNQISSDIYIYDIFFVSLLKNFYNFVTVLSLWTYFAPLSMKRMMGIYPLVPRSLSISNITKLTLQHFNTCYSVVYLG